MHSGHVALAACRRIESPLRTDPEGSAVDSPRGKLAEKKIQANALRADRHQVGRLGAMAQERHLDKLALLHIFLGSWNDDEPIGPAEGGDRA